MSSSQPAKKRGHSFRTKRGNVAPPGLQDLVPTKREEDTVEPAAVYTARAMFGLAAPKPKAAVAAVAAKPKSRINAPKVVKPLVKPLLADVLATKKPEVEAAAEAAFADLLRIREEESATDAGEGSTTGPATGPTESEAITDSSAPQGLTDDLKEMADLIFEEESAQKVYGSEAPESYVPNTRRGFAEFMDVTYSAFRLPDGAIEIPEGEKYYPYQKLVRDYMRQESPYRGVLVYHGLGSGKTCTSIAAAEALFSVAHKKIIVMTPFSLRKNFLNEVSFCGFRHFQLKNFWTKFDIKDPAAVIFANQVLGLSGKYLQKAKHIWIPDFRKPQNENNYFKDPARPEKQILSDEERNEIRNQILSIIEWDPEKNPTGRIRFINYNGISAKKLQKLACEMKSEKFFDNAAIVIDEVHNLVRLMQGTIDPYLIHLKGFKRLIAPEDITAERWKPTLCPPPPAPGEKEGESNRYYKRGYLFYRLLLDAQNSKIIGLSGTPLINFPEELGIMANILHGYIPVIEGVVPEVGGAVHSEVERIARANPYIDFVRASAVKAGTQVIMTVLPRGVEKIADDVGVRRMDEPGPEPRDVLAMIVDAFKKEGLPFQGEPVLKAEALLPPFGEQFGEAFVQGDGSSLKNQPILITRLTGLVSYYKGSRLDLMPRIKSDEIVRVPFSLYAQRGYSVKRAQEAKKELEKSESAGKGFSADWAQVYEVNEKTASSNYKMGSRQACNFVFPNEVSRPTRSEKEAMAEAEKGGIKDDLLTLAPDLLEAIEKAGAEEELVLGDAEAVEAEEADEAENAAEAEDALEDEAAAQTGGGPTIRFYSQLDNQYKAFSNFAAAPFTIDGKSYPTAEHYYQSMKFQGTDPAWQEAIRTTSTPAKAKVMGGAKSHPIRADFEATKDVIMLEALRAKFGQNEALKQLLLSTGYSPLVEASPTNAYWGEGPNKQGQNKLGKLLVELRKELGGAEAIADEVAADAVATAASAPEVATVPKPTVAVTLKARREQLLADCKSGRKPGEEYETACERSMKCLATLFKDKMTVGTEGGLGNYSPKYAAMLKNIAAAPGSSLVYSQFVSMEGIGLFRVAMDVNGYAPIEIVPTGSGLAFSKAAEKSLRLGPGKQPRYMTFSGGEDEATRRMALNIFNAKFSELPESMNKVLTESGYTDNKQGELCRVFCISSAGAEGLSLRNVRAVHIMEPYWNEARLKQVKGRAIRIGSHMDLPESERDVRIYTYISVFGDEAQTAKAGDMRIDATIRNVDRVERKEAIKMGLPVPKEATEYVLTSDERLSVISQRKQKIIDELESIMKSSSIDCELNLKQNKDGSFKCLPLKGKVGDFMYNPILSEDIREGAKFSYDKKPEPRVTLQKYKQVAYRMREVLNEAGQVTGFELFEPKDKGFTKRLGTAGAKDGKPAPPVVMETS